jgi:serine protease
MKRYCTLTLLAIGLVSPSLVTAQASGPSPEFNGRPSRSATARPTGRILLKWRKEAVRSLSPASRAQKASVVAGLKLQRSELSTEERDILQAETTVAPADIERAVQELERDSNVEYASVEYRRKAHALTSDTLLLEQWYLLSGQPSATRTEAAWDTTQGSASVVVAVLDTGVRYDHPDLGSVGPAGGKLLPGYDFVSNTTVANDGGGRDADASDPGDWVTTNDLLNPQFADCEQTASSWHGTRVAGLIGAQTNNGEGVAGNAWNTQILPLRVLGKCGGTDADIMDAMRWAAGLTVAGLPANPTPAKVINLSLGGEGPCTSAYQNTVNDVIAAGALVIASAGNEGTQVSAPANCNGVLGVAGIRHIGTKVGFSNLGPQVGIGAPGGNCVNTIGACLFSIVVATNTGAQGPGTHGYTDQTNYNVGTSFSAPMAASAAALLRAVNGTLTPAQIVLLLKDSATPYPVNPSVNTCTVPTATSAPQTSECNCTTSTCGAGMLNTGAAIAAAQKPLAVLQTSGTATVGSTVSLNASASFASQGHSIASYQWSVVDVTGTAPTIANASAATTTMQFPGTGDFTLRLTVTDEQGTQDSRDLPMTAAAAPSTPTTPTPPTTPTTPTMPNTGISNTGGGGGGGAIGWEWLLIGVLGAAQRRRSR